MPHPASELANCVRDIQASIHGWADTHPRTARIVDPVTAYILALLQSLIDLFAQLAAAPRHVAPNAAPAPPPLASSLTAAPIGPARATAGPYQARRMLPRLAPQVVPLVAPLAGPQLPPRRTSPARPVARHARHIALWAPPPARHRVASGRLPPGFSFFSLPVRMPKHALIVPLP